MDNLCCNCREQPITQEEYGTCDDKICISSIIKLRAKIKKFSFKRIRRETKRALGGVKPPSPRTTILGLRKMGFTSHKNFKLTYKGNTYRDTTKYHDDET